MKRSNRERGRRTGFSITLNDTKYAVKFLQIDGGRTKCFVYTNLRCEPFVAMSKVNVDEGDKYSSSEGEMIALTKALDKVEAYIHTYLYNITLETERDIEALDGVLAKAARLQIKADKKANVRK